MPHRLLLLSIMMLCTYFPLNAQDISEKNATDIICGAERMQEYLPLLSNKKVALVINQSARVGDRLLLDTLVARNINVVKVFVPEHGLRGQADAGADINNDKDKTTGIPIMSLYGKSQKPSAAQLHDVDIVVYDLQDVGVRFYTYIATLQYVMEACAENDKPLMILDRPNPNGFYVDGPVLDTALHSFVGMQPIPVVYGMTCGEYAKMLEGERWCKGADRLQLTVIACDRYDHTKKYQLKYPPSPNLKTMTAVYLYPSLCFFEGTVVSVGRGTDIPFEHWGAPEFEGKTNYSFTPQSREGATKPMYEGKKCWGVSVADNSTESLTSINNEFIINKLSLAWLIQAYDWYPEKEKFFNNFFEKLSGNRSLRAQILAGKTEKQIHDSWQQDIKAFKKIRKKYLLYRDFE